MYLSIHRRYVLDMSESIDNFGPLRWQMVLCSLLAWIVVFGCLAKGVASLGKVRLVRYFRDCLHRTRISGE